jgi:formiminotetrahydrofolate cyclodeaminase
MSDYVDGPVGTYVADLSSDKPVPGGGSAAALAGALGAAAASMAANFTLGRPKFAAVEAEVKRALADLHRLRSDLLRLVDEDVRAYSLVAPAYQMPRGTEAEKAARAAAIQSALRTACGVPLAVCAAALAALRSTESLVGIVNPMLVSDVAVGAVLCEAAFRAAQVNVEVNIRAMKDAGFVAATRARVEAEACTARDVAQRVAAAADQRMKA